MAGFDILSIIGDPWTESASTYGGIKLSVTDTASRYNSKFLELVLNGSPRFTIWKTGETFISNAAGTSRGGFALRGNAGEMAFTSQTDPNTGLGADLFRWYWEGTAIGSAPGSVAVLRGMGTNRLSIESNGSMVHIAKNGRYEFESMQAGVPIQFIAYKASSSAGIPFLFNNHGQSALATSVVQVGVNTGPEIAFQTGIFTGQTFTATTYIDGSGGIYARGLSAIGDTGTFRGLSARATNDVTARGFLGVGPTDVPFLGMGTGGSMLDSFITRAGPNLFAFAETPSASVPAIKGTGTAIQGRLGDDSDFCTVQGKLTTDQGAVTETITPDSTLTLYDASGTAYKVPCVAA